MGEDRLRFVVKSGEVIFGKKNPKPTGCIPEPTKGKSLLGDDWSKVKVPSDCVRNCHASHPRERWDLETSNVLETSLDDN